jgi:hypothetical protein
MSPASRKKTIRGLILAGLVLLVGGVWLERLRRDAASEAAPNGGRAVASAPTTSGSAARGADAVQSSSVAPSPSSVRRTLADAGGPVYLRINELRLVHPAPKVRGHLRANVNSAYYDYPSEPGDAGGPGSVELGESTHGKFYEIPRSVSYEIYFELLLPRGQKVSGTAETVNLTSATGTLSDKVPYTEEYNLYMTGHGMRAREPTAVVSYTITETP